MKNDKLSDFENFRHNTIAWLAKGGIQVADAEDAVQFAMLQLALTTPKFANDQSISRWLHKVARNYIVDNIRRCESQRCVSLENIAHTAHTDEMALLQINIDMAIAELSDEDRKLVEGILAGWEQNEIASVLHITVEATKKQIQRMRPRFLIILKKHGIEIKGDI